MASTTDDPLPIKFEKALIGAYLDSTFLMVLLMGAYTVIYLGTLHLYLTRKNKINKVIVGAITSLYMVSLVQLCLQWFALQQDLISYGNTRSSILSIMYGQSTFPVQAILAQLLQYIAYLLADSLLVWRCIKLHGHWSRMLLIPIFLFTVEITLVIVAMRFVILIYVGNKYAIDDYVHQFDAVDGALGITAAVTSLLVTLFICYRIHISAKNVMHPTYKQRYKLTIRILIDSSMLYSLSMGVNSILTFLSARSLTSSFGVATDVGRQFMTTLVIVISGLAPTLMVARITTYNSNMRDITSIKLPSDLAQISQLYAPTESVINTHYSDVNVTEARCRVAPGTNNV